MRESDCQREVSRSTKLPEEVYRMAFSYERVERAYKSYTGKPASSAPQITIKQESVSNIRRRQGYFRGRARGDTEDKTQAQAVRDLLTVGVTIVRHRLLHIASCPAKGVTYNACRKLVLFERTFRGLRRGTNQWRGRGQVGMVRDENEHHQSTHSVEKASEDQVA